MCIILDEMSQLENLIQSMKTEGKDIRLNYLVTLKCKAESQNFLDPVSAKPYS